MAIYGWVLIALMLIGFITTITSDLTPATRLGGVMSQMAIIIYIALTLFNK
jgi:hypothetical protein